MADESDDEWRFSVDEVGPDDANDQNEAVEAEQNDAEGGLSVEMVGEDDDGPTFGVATDDPAADDDEGNVAGELRPEAPVEPGTPDLENVVFATAGAILTALVLAGVVTQLDPVTIVRIAGVISFVSGLLYVLFLRF